MEDLDHILLEQLQAAKRTEKMIKRLNKLYVNDSRILECLERNLLRQKFFDSMIEDKSIMSKKIKRKRINNDILAKSPFYETYRYALTFTLINYKMMSDFMQGYIDFFRKDKK